MRTIITALDSGEVLIQRQRLSKRPSGNALQRKKQLRHGWQPAWVSCGGSTKGPNNSQFLGYLPLGVLPEPLEIEQARLIVASL